MRCNRKSCTYNECGKCGLLCKDYIGHNTKRCGWYRFDLFAALGNHLIFWVAVAFIIIALMLLISL